MIPSTRDIKADACRALAAGARFRFTVAGTSMEPVLRPGDEIEAMRMGESVRASLGDLVVLDLPGQGLVIHRLIWRRADGAARTRGDGSGRVDPVVAPEDVLGRVEAVHRDGRDVTPGALTRRVVGMKCLLLAAIHRLSRRVRAAALAESAAPASR